MYLGLFNNWNIPTKSIYNNSTQESNPTNTFMQTLPKINNVIQTQPKIDDSIKFGLFFKEILSELIEILNMLSKVQARQNTQSNPVPSPVQASQNTQPNPFPCPVQTDISDKSRGCWGDPHFNLIGSNGNEINFDHKGVTGNTYNIFNGDNLTIDGKYVDYKDPKNPQVIGTARVEAGSDELLFTKDGKTSLNGKKLRNGSYTLKDNTVVDVNGKVVKITTPEEDALVSLRAEKAGITIDPSGSFSNINGIIGKAILNNVELTKAQCEKFDVTAQRKI